MARNKDEEKKRHLIRERNANKRAPVWITLKTASRDFIRRRTRNWRSGKLGKKIRHMNLRGE